LERRRGSPQDDAASNEQERLKSLVNVQAQANQRDDRNLSMLVRHDVSGRSRVTAYDF
jgi:hypothetical protein